VVALKESPLHEANAKMAQTDASRWKARNDEATLVMVLAVLYSGWPECGVTVLTTPKRRPRLAAAIEAGGPALDARAQAAV
jgi:hypothetical protein